MAGDSSNWTRLIADGSSRVHNGHRFGDITINHVSNDVHPVEVLSSPCSTVPFQRDPDFVTRPSIQDELQAKMSHPSARIALVGLGGAGKTQLAVEYGQWTRRKDPQTWVLWINAGTPARFEQSVRDIADRVKINGRGEPTANIFRLLRDWLSDERNGKWLIILDNVDDATYLLDTSTASQKRLIDYLPVCEHGSILMTSRSRREALRLLHEQQIVSVMPMEHEEAEGLLAKVLGEQEHQSHHLLADALDCIPLALAQASAYIRERRPRYSVEDYVRRLNANRRSTIRMVRHDERSPNPDNATSSSTWQISFEHIHRVRRSAADLLSVMSFCDREANPEMLLRHGEYRTDGRINRRQSSGHRRRSSRAALDQEFDEDIAMLRSFSFISPTLDRSTNWEMHRLVQNATRLWLEERGEYQRYYERSLHNLKDAFPSGDYENWQTCQMLFPHALSIVRQQPITETALLSWSRIMYCAAWYTMRKGQHDHALAMAERSMDARASVFGATHELTLESTTLVAIVLSDSSRWNEAEQLQVKVVEANIARLGPFHRSTLWDMNNLALTYRRQGRLKQAERLQVKVMERSAAHLGPSDPATLIGKDNLALTYYEQGRFDEAERMQKDVLQARISKLGDDHPDTLTSMNNLASMYQELGRLGEAERLQVKVLEMRKEEFGSDHLDTLKAIHNLAHTFAGQARLEEAEELFVQLAERLPQHFGACHPRTLETVAALEDVRQRMRSQEEGDC